MCAWGDTVMLRPPRRRLTPNRLRNNWVRIDRCLVDAVLALWSFGYATIGSCCGHGRAVGSIEVCP